MSRFTKAQLDALSRMPPNAAGTIACRGLVLQATYQLTKSDKIVVLRNMKAVIVFSSLMESRKSVLRDPRFALLIDLIERILAAFLKRFAEQLWDFGERTQNLALANKISVQQRNRGLQDIKKERHLMRNRLDGMLKARAPASGVINNLINLTVPNRTAIVADLGPLVLAAGMTTDATWCDLKSDR